MAYTLRQSHHAELEKHIGDMEILITTPFHPAYMSKERLQKASKLKLIMTAGVGSDHVDLNTAADKGMTVVEVSGMQTFPAASNLGGSQLSSCTWHCCKTCSTVNLELLLP